MTLNVMFLWAFPEPDVPCSPILKPSFVFASAESCCVCRVRYTGITWKNIRLHGRPDEKHALLPAAASGRKCFSVNEQKGRQRSGGRFTHSSSVFCIFNHQDRPAGGASGKFCISSLDYWQNLWNSKMEQLLSGFSALKRPLLANSRPLPDVCLFFVLFVALLTL